MTVISATNDCHICNQWLSLCNQIVEVLKILTETYQVENVSSVYVNIDTNQTPIHATHTYNKQGCRWKVLTEFMAFDWQGIKLGENIFTEIYETMNLQVENDKTGWCNM